MKRGPALNGINAITGNYLEPGVSEEELAWGIRNAKRDHSRERVLELAFEAFGRRKDPDRRPAPGVDPKNLASSGWGVIFPENISLEVRDALAPLLNYRKQQAGKGEYFRELVYKPGWSKDEFFKELGVNDGPAHPEQLPYYLLLVGGEEQIPHRFQYMLDVQYAVGRLDFDNPKDYRTYAENVKACERGSAEVSPEAVLFGASHENDLATLQSRAHLVRPLDSELREKHREWPLRTIEQGRKEELVRLFNDGRAPALLFTATHGLAYPSGHPEQRELQGSLLCQDWEGPGSGPIPDSAFFSARDLPDAARLRGIVAFLFGCYTAGTPELDGFPPLPMRNRIRRAPRHFTSGLVRRLLAHPGGGALAVVGHVDRAWTHSFSPGRGKSVGVISYVVQHMLSGFPVGCAMDFLNERFSETSTYLTDHLNQQKVPLQRGSSDEELTPEELIEAWRMYTDARNYVVYGDPAVRLVVGSSGEPSMSSGLPTASSEGTLSLGQRLDAALTGLRSRSPVPVLDSAPDDRPTDDEEEGAW